MIEALDISEDRFCGCCGDKLVRKRFIGGRLEDAKLFANRSHCNRTCANKVVARRPRRKKQRIKFKCLHCGTEGESRHSTRAAKFCNTDCHKAYMKIHIREWMNPTPNNESVPTEERVCPCGATFIAPVGMSRIYHSLECMLAHL